MKKKKKTLSKNVTDSVQMSLTGYGGVREPDAYLRIVRTVVRTGLDVHQGLLGHRQRV